MTWIKTATKLGYTEDKLSKAIKRKIANYNTVQASLVDIQKEIDVADDADKPGMQSQLEEVKTGLENLDAEISADIEKYKKNEAFNKARSEKMQLGRLAKKDASKKSASGKGQPKNQAPVVQITPEPVIQTTVVIPEEPVVEIPAQTAQSTTVVEEPIIEVPEPKKKKSYTGLWIGLFAALGIGGVAVAVKMKVGPFKK